MEAQKQHIRLARNINIQCTVSMLVTNKCSSLIENICIQVLNRVLIKIKFENNIAVAWADWLSTEQEEQVACYYQIEYGAVALIWYWVVCKETS
jgi:ABC-type iron transport system FetAB ATPase subunit